MASLEESALATYARAPIGQEAQPAADRRSSKAAEALTGN
jgi:hypothetical protein